jgi:L-fuculose-phosphate aldolase
MNFSLLHPREQIAETMSRVYAYGMTTTSGGNISVREDDGSVWITPAAVDKEGLKPEDVVRISPTGTTEGLHRPSSESPFHLQIYEARPDLGAILHAHPPALVSFSIVRLVPDTRVISQASHVCGSVGYARYELPGTRELGDRIAAIFADGYDTVVMENHGTVVGGATLAEAFQKFETLEFAARTVMEARILGEVKYLSNDQLALFDKARNNLPELSSHEPSSPEKSLRGQLIDVVRRAYRQRLIVSTYGTFSVRTDDGGLLITPTGADRAYLDRKDLVYVRGGKREPAYDRRALLPSRAVRLHERIYKEHPEINSIILAQSPSAMAYAVTGTKLDTRTIPESYVLLRDIPIVPFGDQFRDGAEISKLLAADAPILLLENDSILVTGSSLFETFDRLEVCEFSARSLTQSRSLGDMVPMGDEQIDAIKKKFLE